jgi:phage major head subunit gpT-like protein
MFAITRKNLIDDDLGALSAVPRKLGRGGALKLNEVFWTEFLADASTFYTTGRGNYFTGSATNLQSASLKTAVQMFRKQIDPDSKPLGVQPSVLLIAPEDEVAADELFTSTHVNTGGSATTEKVPSRNVFQNKYRPVVSSYLSNTSITGYSTTAWFLIAAKEALSLIEVAFLNGKEMPTVDNAQADFNTLGIQMRGYHDFGVNKQEYRAAVKSKGAA